MKRTLIGLLVLLAMSFATVNSVKVAWNNTRATDTLRWGKVLYSPKYLTGTKACTTATITWSSTPYVALSWNSYVQATVDDTGKYNVLYAYGNNTGFADRLETLIVGCMTYGDNDTLRYEARHHVEQFYPSLSTRGYFIFQGTTGNSDSLMIDSIYFLSDPR